VSLAGGNLEHVFDGALQEPVTEVRRASDLGSERGRAPPQPNANECGELPPRPDPQEEDGEGCLERTFTINSRGQGDADVEGKADGSDRRHRFRGGNVQSPEVDCKGGAEKEQRKLQHNGQRLHDPVQSPLLKSDEFGLTLLPSVNNVPPRCDSSVIQDPLFTQHCDEGHEERDGQTGEKDGLSSEGADGDIRDGCQGIGSTKRRVLL